MIRTLCDRSLICSVIILAFDTPLTKKLFRRRLPAGFFLAKLHTQHQDLGTSVDLNETMHATPMSTINHENNVLMLLLVHY